MRRSALAAALALTFTLLAGCGGGGQSAGSADPAEPVVVRYGISNAWDQLMPYNSVSGSNYARIVYDKIYDRLAYVHADGTLSPRAAESWESADGGYAVLFHLDPEAAFHDGAPVTAEHWVETIRLMTDPACPMLGRATFSVLTGTDENGAALPGEEPGAEAVDAHTLKLTFKDTTAPEDFLLDKNRELYVLPTHLLEEVDPAEVLDLDLWDAPIGSGPCVFVEQLPGSRLTLAANEDYHLGAPGFDQLTITVMDKANLLPAMISGDLDYYAFGGSVSAEDRAAAEQNGLEVEEGTVPNTFFELMLNGERIPDARIRRAIELALDKELLCQQATGGQGSVTYSSISPASPYAGWAAEGEGRDLEEATALLEEAGYDGRTYVLACTSNRSGLAALIQQNLAEAGISLSIQTVDSATMFSGMADGVYDMGIASHTPGALPLWFVESRFAENNNIFHVQDLEPYAALIDAIQSASSQEEKGPLVGELEALLAQERPFIPLWFGRGLHVQSPTVENIDYASSSFSNENVWEWVKH